MHENNEGLVLGTISERKYDEPSHIETMLKNSRVSFAKLLETCTDHPNRRFPPVTGSRCVG